MNARANALVDAAGTDEERRALRQHSLALADALARDEGPEAGLDFLRTLFARGLYNRPPISGEAYTAWRRLAAAAPLPPVPAEGPRISVLMPVCNPRPEHLRAALDSVLAQTWQDWELCVADDASTREDTRPLLEDYARRDPRLRLIFRPENGHISAACNSALELATGQWCALLDQDDLLPPEALAVVAAAVNAHPGAEAFFSDEDQFTEDEDGRRTHLNPLFKPGLDPELLLCCNCVNHLGVYRTATLRALNGFISGLEGAQDYDLVLRLLARYGEGAFVHIPRVLYHWRRHEGSTSADWAAKPYARDAAQRARASFASATGLHAELPVPEGSTHAHPCFQPPRRAPLLTVALLADTAPVPALTARWSQWLEQCGMEHETLLVCPAAAQEHLRPLAGQLRARLAVAHGTDPVTLADKALRSARGGILCFQRINDAPLASNWAAQACGALLRPGIAAVGFRSLSPRGFFQHAGYAVGHQRTPDGELPVLCPAYQGLHQRSGGYFNWINLPHAVPAVRLDGLCCRRDLLEDCNGLDTHAGLWADADFCFSAWSRRGLRSLVLPLDILSVGSAAPVAASPALRERWGELLAAPPFQNPALSWTPGGWRLRPL